MTQQEKEKSREKRAKKQQKKSQTAKVNFLAQISAPESHQRALSQASDQNAVAYKIKMLVVSRASLRSRDWS